MAVTRNPRCAGGRVGGRTAWTRVATRALDAIARGAFTATPRLAVTEESWEAIIVFRRCLSATPTQNSSARRSEGT